MFQASDVGYNKLVWFVLHKPTQEQHCHLKQHFKMVEAAVVFLASYTAFPHHIVFHTESNQKIWGVERLFHVPLQCALYLH